MANRSSKKKNRVSPEGIAFIKASFNNTIITITDKNGNAKFYLPGPGYYAVSIKFNDVEEVLYEESLTPGNKYIYRPDPSHPAGRYFILTEG